MDNQRRRIYFAAGILLCALSGLLVVVLIANWARSHNNPAIKSQSSSAVPLLPAGSAAPRSAQTDDGPIVTIFRGGKPPTIVPGSPESAASLTDGVTIFAGTRIVVVPQQTAELPGAALAIGAGAGMSGGTVALSTR